MRSSIRAERISIDGVKALQAGDHRSCTQKMESAMTAHKHHGADRVVEGDLPRATSAMNITPMIDVLLVLLTSGCR
jgi:biopolymer transport protein ExbD